jgi:hypothetical protein
MSEDMKTIEGNKEEAYAIEGRRDEREEKKQEAGGPFAAHVRPRGGVCWLGC